MKGREGCVFCRIAGGEIPATKLFENERIMAFEDASPLAPFHALVIPRRHIATLNDLEETDGALVGEIVLVGRSIAREAGLFEGGYRLVLNCNADAGQEVFHLHCHVLGGRKLGALVSAP